MQWPLVTADIVGGSGCFHLYQPKAWSGSNKLAIPPPTPYGQTDECLVLVQTCPPPPPVTSPPPLYLSGDNQLITRFTQPTMTAVGNTTGAPVTVLLNGTLITTKSLVVDPGTGVVQGFDATVALSGSADGSVPATPLGRHVRIDVQLPKEYGPPLVGPPPGSGPGLSASPRVAVAHKVVAHDAAPFNCDDPVVKGAPELADLGDPSSVRASLGQLNLGGSDARAYVYDGQVIVCVDIALPVGNCGATSDFEVKATLLAKQDGLELQDLYAHLDCGMIAGVVFSDLTFSFSNATKAWQAEGTVEAIPGIALRGEVEFAHGAFLRAAISTQPAYLPLGFLTLKDVGIEVTPTETSGHVDFGSLLKVPYTHLDPLSISAKYKYVFDADPHYFEAKGDVSVFGAHVLDGDVFVFDGPKVHGTAHFGIDLAGVLTADATVTADYLSSSRWDVEGEGHAALLGVSVDGQIVASDRGVGACVDAFGVVHIGVVISSNGDVKPFFDTCDITGARDVLPKVRTAGTPLGGETPTATSNTLSVRVDAGKAVFFGVKGVSGPPAFTLVGPKGQRRDVPSTGGTLSKTVAILHDAKNAITYVGIPHPAAGTWHVVAAPGSQLTELRTGVARPPAAVTAKVVRHGSSYTLSYKGPKVAGQSVDLVERGRNGLRLLATVKGGGNGSFTFVPTPGSTAPREIEAMVSQDGLPRTELKAGSYRTPQVKAPRKAPKATVVRKGGSVVVRWSPVAGADHYLATIRTSDGRARSFLTKGLSVSLGKVALTSTATVTVRGMTAGLRGKLVTLHLAGQALTLSKVSFGPITIGKKVTKATLAFTANRGARVQVSMRAVATPATVLIALTKAVKAGKDRYVVPLTVKGKRLKAGRYLVLVVLTARGLPAVRRSWVVTLR
jgi:hypothetical protein